MEKKSSSGEGNRKYGFKKKFEDEPSKSEGEGRSEGEKKPYRDKKPYGDKKPFKKFAPRPFDKLKTRDDGNRTKGGSDRGERKPYGDRKPFKKQFGERKAEGGSDRKPYIKRTDRDSSERTPFRKKFGEKREGSFNKRFDRDKDKDRGERKPYGDRKPFEKREGSDRPERKSFGDKKPYGKKFDRDRGPKKPFRKEFNEDFKEKKKAFLLDEKVQEEGLTRLNKYIANAGVCSRREADDLIKTGVVKVNGVVITEMGFKVKPGDVVNFGGESLSSQKKVYVLLNKPKDYITTTDDPEGRKNVMMLVEKACKERIYPVGRLDRATTGVLLFTNDGELAKVLTHPKHNVAKMYHVELDKSLTGADFEAIMQGVKLEDGTIAADVMDYIGDGSNKREIGLEIHSGKNRIIRRMFEHLGYRVVKLDRVMFAGLTKKDVSRGHWRFLTPKEVGYLKMLGAPKE